VRLGAASPQFVAQNTNLQYLLELDIDSMVWSFRKVANLDAPGKPYGGWESPVSELRGHFVGQNAFPFLVLVIIMANLGEIIILIFQSDCSVVFNGIVLKFSFG
jgi:hypothetical protein